MVVVTAVSGGDGVRAVVPLLAAALYVSKVSVSFDIFKAPVYVRTYDQDVSRMSDVVRTYNAGICMPVTHRVVYLHIYIYIHISIVLC